MLNGVTSRLYIFSAGSEKAAVQGSQGPFLYKNPLATNENPVCHESYIAYVITARYIGAKCVCMNVPRKSFDRSTQQSSILKWRNFS